MLWHSQTISGSETDSTPTLMDLIWCCASELVPGLPDAVFCIEKCQVFHYPMHYNDECFAFKTPLVAWSVASRLILCFVYSISSGKDMRDQISLKEMADIQSGWASTSVPVCLRCRLPIFGIHTTSTSEIFLCFSWFRLPFAEDLLHLYVCLSENLSHRLFSCSVQPNTALFWILFNIVLNALCSA